MDMINLAESDQICQHSSCILSSLKGLRNGIYYGGKIRFFHALVMTFLFKKGSFSSKIKTILTLSYEHSIRLGVYVFIYKLVLCLLRNLFKKNYKIFPFLSGLIGSFVVWSKKNTVNQQLMLYLLSRNLQGISGYFNNQISVLGDKAFPIMSILCWGVVMFLFETKPNFLQPSLYDSMDFLYNTSDIIQSWKDFIPIYIP